MTYTIDEFARLSREDKESLAFALDSNGNVCVRVLLVSSEWTTKNITTVNAATYELVSWDEILHVTYTATWSVAITLPTAQTLEGKVITVKDAWWNAWANNIVIDTESTETIDGENTYTISSDDWSVTLYSNGVNWYTM